MKITPIKNVYIDENEQSVFHAEIVQTLLRISLKCQAI